MPIQSRTLPYEPSEDRVKVLSRMIEDAQDMREAAFEAGSYSAANQLLQEERRLRTELNQCADGVEAAKRAAEKSKPKTAKDRAAQLKRLIAGASIEELEVAFDAYLMKMRYRAYVDDGGTLHVVPLGENVTELRRTS